MRASVDSGISWPYRLRGKCVCHTFWSNPAQSDAICCLGYCRYTLQATVDNAPHDGTVFDRQAFGYSCLSHMPKHSQYTHSTYMYLTRYVTKTPHLSCLSSWNVTEVHHAGTKVVTLGCSGRVARRTAPPVTLAAR